MKFSDDDLISSAEAAEKPNKENAANAPYRFPKYLDRGSNRIELNFTERSPVIDFIENRLNSNSIFRIDPERVLHDGRTTCMIKNIPNKFNSSMLVDFINQTHFGQYDFLYLRMDFKNKCNVGYAFINFTGPLSVQSFYYRINGKKWKNFSSGKIAELTYATVQGFENLVKKFRNSSIMGEDKMFRPKIFYRDGPLRGFEKGKFE